MNKWFSNRNFGTKIFFNNALALVLFFIIIFVLKHNVDKSMNTYRWVNHTDKVISQGHILSEILLSIESNERGFLITGNEEFLKAYKKNKERYRVAIAHSMTLVTDNPSQVTLLKKIENQTFEWDNKFGEAIIRLREDDILKGKNDFSILEKVLGKGEGKNILDSIRVSLKTLNEAFLLDNNMQAMKLVVELAKDIVDQETGQRGFLITSKKEFLEPYKEGGIALKRHLEELQKIINDTYNKDEMWEMIKTLNNLTASWEKNIALPSMKLGKKVKQGEKTYSQLKDEFGKNDGKKTLDQIRVLIKGMDRHFEKAQNEYARKQLINIAKAMVDQETGIRGYLLTGNKEFLEPYYSGRQDLEKFLNELNKLVNNSIHIEILRKEIKKFKDLTLQWKEKAAQPEIALRNKITVHNIILGNIKKRVMEEAGKKTMDDLLGLLKQFIDVEKQLLKERTLKASEAAKATTSIVYFLSGISLLILLLNWLLSRAIPVLKP